MGLIGSDGRAGVYWRAQDGNIYTRNNLGQIMQAGTGIGVLASGDQKFGGLTYREIAAPTTNQPAPQQLPQPVSQASAPAPSAPNGGGSAAYVAPKPDRSNSIAMQNAGLASADEQLTTGIAAIEKALGRVMGQYDTESTANEKTYTDQSNNNQNNLQTNKQTTYVNAAQGRRGLFGSLAGIGALNGDGIFLANRAVQKGANDDLTGAANNYDTNQTQLDTAIGQFRQEDKMRRDNARSAAENAKTNARGEVAKSKLGFLTNLVNDYTDMGDAASAKKYTDMAAAMYPEIARGTIPNAEIGYSGAAFTPGTLANYMSGADTVVSTTPAAGNGTPGLIASPTKRKDRLTV